MQGGGFCCFWYICTVPHVGFLIILIQPYLKRIINCFFFFFFSFETERNEATHENSFRVSLPPPPPQSNQRVEFQDVLLNKLKIVHESANVMSLNITVKILQPITLGVAVSFFFFFPF